MHSEQYIVGLETFGIILHNNIKNLLRHQIQTTHIDHYDDIINHVYSQVILESMNILEADYNIFLRSLLAEDISRFSYMYELPELQTEEVKIKLLNLYKDFALNLFFIFVNKRILNLNNNLTMSFVLESATKDFIVIRKFIG